VDQRAPPEAAGPSIGEAQKEAPQRVPAAHESQNPEAKDPGVRLPEEPVKAPAVEARRALLAAPKSRKNN